MTLDEFVARHEAVLRAGLVAAYGPQIGAEATADALAYAAEHWDRLERMDNPTGYLYRVGQSASRSYLRRPALLPAVPAAGLPDFEPGLAPALEELSESQRVCIILVHALGWTQVDAARLLGIDVSSVRTHIRRGMTRLRTALKVERDAG